MAPKLGLVTERLLAGVIAALTIAAAGATTLAVAASGKVALKTRVELDYTGMSFWATTPCRSCGQTLAPHSYPQPVLLPQLGHV